ncbi:spore germination protein B1 [Clostridium homopropionicum DSM 5847]|uniref:Spore germination protein B1 n=1 Tax=Clostridium homopropionicum DSM 5847 TaxID=1121318 RepID=A0A0L6Z7N2_9CLOT|nr:spore germination protein [Clostridium homopropionicum]KOA18803.1 spore germination protein B1 [Clostridium homopropionicum DSM 5847]SFG76758.1 spore germination protein KA [Clostridium homopropionicum]
MEELVVSESLKENIKIIKKIFSNNDSIVYRELKSKNARSSYCLIYIDGMVNNNIVNENIIKPIMGISLKPSEIDIRYIDYISLNIIEINNVQKSKSITEVAESINRGKSILFVEGSEEALILETTDIKERQITEPPSESVVRGPRVGFTEAINTNITLLTKLINNTDLKFQYITIGNATKTKICISYIEGIAHNEVVNEVIQRINNINIDGILESYYIEELIQDNALSIFKTVGSTERPDVVASKLLEGRVAIICDNSSFVLTVPFLFIEYFQVNEDYYHGYMFSSFNRILRAMCFWLTISVPALYIGIVNFHHEILPTNLYISIAQARAGVPIPTVIEAVVMLVTFEILREAGARLPKQIGQAVSIVGALVLGESAVNARLVSAPMVIITAITGISGFTIPNLITTSIILRVLLICLSTTLGLFGYSFGLIAISFYLVSMNSFGINYMEYTSLIDRHNFQDSIIRKPWPYMDKKPQLLAKDAIRLRFKNRRKGK